MSENTLVDLFNKYSKIEEETLKEIYYACNRSVEDTELRLIELFADLLFEDEATPTGTPIVEESKNDSGKASAKKSKKSKKIVATQIDEEVGIKKSNDFNYKGVDKIIID